MASISSTFISSRPITRPDLLNNPRAVRFRPASAKRDTYGSDFGGGFGLVDENMIVLRKRIYEMEVAERNYEPPSHWAEWEKRYYTTYGSHVCGFVGMLQTLLMRTRPSLAIGLAVSMAMSVPMSGVLIWVHVVEAVRTGVFGG